MKYYMTTNGNRKNIAPLSLFDSFFGDSFFTGGNRDMRTDIIDRGESYDLSIEMPGYDKSKIALDYADGYLTVSATRETDTEYLRRESSVSCSRKYYVGDVEQSQLKARYDNGILVVTLPKEHLIPKSTSIAID